MKTLHIGETMHPGGGHRTGADRIMNEAVFIGTYPGLTPAMLDYMAETIRHFTTDAHLVTWPMECAAITPQAEAKRHGMKLATLDSGLIGKPWAAGIAENPLLSPKPSSTSG